MGSSHACYKNIKLFSVVSSMGSKPRVLVAGAGVSGLALAHYLKHRCVLTLAERASRTGGWVHTRQVDGFLFETGPRSLLARKGAEDCLALVEDLSLSSQVVLSDPNAARRFVWCDDMAKPLLLPSGPDIASLSALRPPIFSSQFFSACAKEPLVKPQLHDESVYDWTCRRFNQHIADWLIDPLVAGIYAGDPKRLSVQSCFGRLADMERQHGSIVRAMFKQKKSNLQLTSFGQKVWKNGTYSFSSGMSALTDSLMSQLGPKVNLRLGENGCIKGLLVNPSGGVLACLQGENGCFEWERFDYVCSTLSAQILASLLSLEHCPVAPPADMTVSELTKQLVEVLREDSQSGAATVWVVNMGWKNGQVLPAALKGFGLLVPTKQKLEILGISFDSCIFPEQQPVQAAAAQGPQTRLTVMLGGARHPWLCELPEASIFSRALSALELCFGSKVPAPDVYLCSLQRDCIPQYSLHHTHRVQRALALADKLKGLKLLGTSFGPGVSVNDCISSAKATVSALRRERPYDFMRES
eukprot:g35579.t1